METFQPSQSGICDFMMISPSKFIIKPVKDAALPCNSMKIKSQILKGGKLQKAKVRGWYTTMAPVEGGLCVDPLENQLSNFTLEVQVFFLSLITILHYISQIGYVPCSDNRDKPLGCPMSLNVCSNTV